MSEPRPLHPRQAFEYERARIAVSTWRSRLAVCSPLTLGAVCTASRAEADGRPAFATVTSLTALSASATISSTPTSYKRRSDDAFCSRDVCGAHDEHASAAASKAGFAI